MEEKQYSPVNTEEIVIERIDDDTRSTRTSMKNSGDLITLWCFRVLFAAAVITVWCFSLHISTGLFKDFLYHCTSYDCAYLNDFFGGTTSKVNDTFCSLNTTSLDNELIYFRTQCTSEINDMGHMLIMVTWIIPFWGVLLSGEEPSEMLWRRFCFLVELIINFLIVWNGVYLFLFIDAVILFVWFDKTPFMCGKYPVRAGQMR